MSNKQTDKMKNKLDEYTMRDAADRVEQARKEIQRGDEIVKRLLANYSEFSDEEIRSMLTDALFAKRRAANQLLNFMEIRILDQES